MQNEPHRPADADAPVPPPAVGQPESPAIPLAPVEPAAQSPIPAPTESPKVSAANGEPPLAGWMPPPGRTPLTTPATRSVVAAAAAAPLELPRAKPERLLALDVLRGITIAGMILVNNPGTWDHIFSPLGHAQWHGLTPTDLVFPFFLFIVGVAMPFSFDRRVAEGASRLRLFEHVVRRSIIIFALGLVLSTFPRWPALVQPELPVTWKDLPLAQLVLPMWKNFGDVLPYILTWRLEFPYVFAIIGLALLFAHDPPFRWPAKLGARIVKVLSWVFLLGAVALFILDFAYFHKQGVRVPGVLQRIGICYFFASLIIMFLGVRGRILCTLAILVGYWAILTYVPAPANYVGKGLKDRPDGVLHDYVDTQALGHTVQGLQWTYDHIWPATPPASQPASGPTGSVASAPTSAPASAPAPADIQTLAYAHVYREHPDPEGLLSTLPAIATVLIGVLAGNWLRTRRESRDKAGWLFLAANVLLVLGLWVGLEVPVSKKIWTSSYVLITGGLGLHFLAACYWLVDVHGRRAWAKPFLVFGSNAIAVYAASGIGARLLNSWIVAESNGAPISAWTYAYQHILGAVDHVAGALHLAWQGTPELASMLCALAYVAIWCVLLIPLYWGRVFIKI
jgi:predicted acyltransferase